MCSSYDELKDAVEGIKDAEKAKEDANQNKALIAQCKLQTSVLSDVKGAFTLYYDIYAAVVKERTSAYKSCIGAALHYKAKEK